MAKEPDAKMKPASMAKIMTTYIAFQRIAEEVFHLTTLFLFQKRPGVREGRKPLWK